MAIAISQIETKNMVTRSKLPDADYVINPYVGCIHKCIYCYAEFMKRFTNHNEDWGEFLDIKNGAAAFGDTDLSDKTVLISSVTDAYNPLERKYCKMRGILSALTEYNIHIDILTKSSLVIRDLDLLLQQKHVKVGLSLNTLDDSFRSKTEPRASCVPDRIGALKQLKEAGLETYIFVGPIFPGITNLESIVEEVYKYTDNIYFENLNLRGAYKKRVMAFINNEFPQNARLYDDIFNKKCADYWTEMEQQIHNLFKGRINYKCYFFHDKIKKK
jgi:DNA repair photolyase